MRLTSRLWNKWNVARISVLALLGFIIYSSSIKIMRGQPVQGDFGVFLHAARLLHAGLDIYEIPTHPVEDGGLFFIYPPIFAVLVTPFIYLDIDTAIVLWTTLNMVFIGVIVVLSWGVLFEGSFFELSVRSRWLVALFSVLLCGRFLLHHLDKGQANLLVLAATIAGIYLAERKGLKISGGIVAGFAAVVKLLSLPVAIWYLLTLRLRSLVGFLLGIIMGVVAPALVVGPERAFDLTSRWLFVYVLDGSQGASHLDVKFNYSVRGQLYRFFGDAVGFEAHGRPLSLTLSRLPESWILGLQALLALLTIGSLALYHYRFRSSPKVVRQGSLALAFLAVPLLFPTSQKHYFVFLLPACVYVVTLWHCYGLRDRVFLLLIITSFLLTGVSSHAVIGNLYSDFLAAAGGFFAERFYSCSRSSVPLSSSLVELMCFRTLQSRYRPRRCSAKDHRIGLHKIKERSFA